MLRDREGKSKRSCFIKYYTTKEAQAAIDAMDGKHKDEDSRDCYAVRMANPKGVNPKQAMPAANPWGAAGMDAYGQQAAAYGQQAAAAAAYGQQPGFGAYGAFGAAAAGMQQPFGGFAAPAAAPQPTATAAMGTGRGPEGANLYVNNLTAETSQQDLQAMFGDFGTVVSLKIFPANSGFCYGFVSYDDANSAQAAIRSLNGTALANSRGRVLEVRLKSDKSAKGNRFTPY